MSRLNIAMRALTRLRMAFRVSGRRKTLSAAFLGLIVLKTCLFLLQYYNEVIYRDALAQRKPIKRAITERRVSTSTKPGQSMQEYNETDFPKTTRKKLILYWSGVRGHKVPVQKTGVNHSHFWPFFYAGKECPVPCELSNDPDRAHEASAFVVHAREPDIWNLPPLEHLAPWILQTNENPVYTPSLSDPTLMSKFNLLISYRLDSDFPAPIYPMPELTPPVPFDKRLGDVLAVFSKCEPVRTEYMRQLMKYIVVDSFGACLKNKDGLIGLYGKVKNRYVFKEHKLILSRYYKFSLVFMNQDCDYFVDDRLYHALTSGSVPVYMGTDKIDEFLPGNLKGAVIKARDFESPKHLARYLEFLANNETAYNKYLEWKWKGLGDISDTVIGQWWKPRYPLFCQVCMALVKGKLHHGLKVDKCKPRTYEDWNLEDPSAVYFDFYTLGIYAVFAAIALWIMLT